MAKRQKRQHPADGNDAGRTSIDPRTFGTGSLGEDLSAGRVVRSTPPAVDKRGVGHRVAPLGPGNDELPQPHSDLTLTTSTVPRKAD